MTTAVGTNRPGPAGPATVPGPAAGSGSTSGGPPARPGVSRPPAASPLVAAGTELALVAVTVAAVVSLVRLFSGGSFVAPVLLAVLSSHLVSWGCRRQGLSFASSAVISGMGMVVAVAWLVESHTTTFGLPGGATVSGISADLQEAWRQFGQVKAPTAPLRGFILVAVVGGWTAAALADFFAFRMRARFEAMAPTFTLFVFGSILGANRFRLPCTLLYLAAVLGFLLWSEAARRSSSGAWFAGRSREGELTVLRDGAILAGVALTAAAFIGPHVPGVASPGLVDWRGKNEQGSRSRVTVSPLVDIRGRLVDQLNTELFAVRSSQPSYWRLTSLDRFDGDIWSSLGTYQSTKGPLPGAQGGRPIVQEFAIASLGSIWLPAAYSPEQVNGIKGARYDRDSSSLLAEAASADGLRYSVVSSRPEPTAAQLASAPANVPTDIGRRYLPLPPGFPAAVTQIAAQVVEGATTPYEKAKTLQDWFRSNFEYDVSVRAGHDVSAIQRFLEVRRGYCEQFAGSFAAMARSLGIPSRVAVGFIPGTPTGDGTYRVAGKDAHAWPEVYLSGFGWVAFEPTPGRGAPGAESYTGIQPPAPGAEGDGGATATSAPPTSAVDSPAPPRPEEQETPAATGDPAEEPGRSGVAAGLQSLALLAALYVVGVPGARTWLKRRRRRGAGTATQQVLVSWQEAEEALALAGHRRRPSETAAEYVRRVRPDVPAAGAQLERLATDSAAAGFSPEGVAGDVAGDAQEAADGVAAALRAQAPRSTRLRWFLDPRPLLRWALTPRPQPSGARHS